LEKGAESARKAAPAVAKLTEEQRELKRAAAEAAAAA
jgi:hypothetical protein